MKILSVISLILFTFSCTMCGSGCALTGTLHTPYGTVSSDGKTVHLEARAGYAK